MLKPAKLGRDFKIWAWIEQTRDEQSRIFGRVVVRGVESYLLFDRGIYHFYIVDKKWSPIPGPDKARIDPLKRPMPAPVGIDEIIQYCLDHGFDDVARWFLFNIERF